MSNPDEFVSRMRKRAAEFDEKRNELVRTVVIAASSSVIQATPVDTGRARNNWLLSLRTPDESVDMDGSFQKSGQTAQTNIETTIKKRKSNEVVYLQNNLPYIGRLNDGWSDQAPANFIQSAVIAVVNAIKKMNLFK